VINLNQSEQIYSSKATRLSYLLFSYRLQIAIIQRFYISYLADDMYGV